MLGLEVKPGTGERYRDLGLLVVVYSASVQIEYRIADRAR